MRSLIIGAAMACMASFAHAATFDFMGYADGVNFTNTNNDVRGGGEADWATIVGGESVGILDVGSGLSVVGSGKTSSGAATNAYFDSGTAGLGVCTNLTGSGQCNPGNDDNVGAIGGSSNAGDGTFETLVLTFSQVVKLEEVLFRAEGHGLFTGDLKINGSLVSVLNGQLMTNLVGSVFDFDYVPVPMGTDPKATNEFYIQAATVSAIPLPAALPMMLVGLGAFGVMRRRRRSF